MKCGFIFPEVKQLALISHDDIVRVLPQPQPVVHTTKSAGIFFCSISGENSLKIKLFRLFSQNLLQSRTFPKLVKVYAPAWFEIKSSLKFHRSTLIIFSSISHAKQLPFEDVK